MGDLDKRGFSCIEVSMREKLNLPYGNNTLADIVDISNEIPTDVNSLIPSYANFLSGRFLKGMDMCGELYAISVAYELKMEVSKKREHGLALILRSKDKGLKTAKEKEAYANTDDLYISASEKHAEAKMFRIRVESMRKDFEKAHYLMRKISEEDNELASKQVSDQNDSAVWSDSTNTRNQW